MPTLTTNEDHAPPRRPRAGCNVTDAAVSLVDLEHLQPFPQLGPRRPFLHPDGGIRPTHAPGSSFSPGFGPSSIRRAQAIPGPPGRAQGLQTREKRERARSVGERTRKPYNLVANPPLPPLVALSPPAPPLANPLVGCLNFAIPPPTSPHQPIFRRPACRLAIFRRRATERAFPA
jgi:hypothetical protein